VGSPPLIVARLFVLPLVVAAASDPVEVPDLLLQAVVMDDSIKDGNHTVPG